MLLDWSGSEKLIAKGRWSSNGPQTLDYHIPLGSNAVQV